VKLGVRLTQLNETRLAARAGELARRRVEQRPVAASMTTEVDDGKRELGAAAGDLRGADKR
jgi:hypothetical protein